VAGNARDFTKVILFLFSFWSATGQQLHIHGPLPKCQNKQRKEIRCDGSSLKENQTQVEKDKTSGTQTKATATSRKRSLKVNKS